MKEKRKNELKELIKEYDKAYEDGKPLISDTEYDRLYEELINLEKELGTDSDSPTTYIEDAKINHLKKVAHGEPMLSQEKCHTASEIRSFVQRTNDKKYIVDLKLDGISIALKYAKGKLIQAVTRGNGHYGYDITAAALKMDGVPKKLLKDIDIEVRGEVIMNEDDFDNLNVNGEYSNSRNFVAGTLNALDVDLVKERRLRVYVYDIRAINGKMGQQMTTEDAHNFLLQLGFDVVKYYPFEVDDLDKMIKFCEDFNETRRPLIEYKIDGLVIKSNDEKIIEKLGSTSKFPKSSIAFKFDSQDRTTKLLKVEWQVGRTGQITPVANFEEIEIDGVNINKASLANIENINKLDVRIGDTIVVARSNDVIPKVISVVKSLRPNNTSEITPPKFCPICGERTRQSGPLLYCDNENCEAKVVARLSHFAKRDAMNINTLSDKTIIAIRKAGVELNEVGDLYLLHCYRDKLISIKGFGKTKVDKLLDEIEKTKSNYLHQLLYGLSIPDIGLSKAKAIANLYKNSDAMWEDIDNDVFREKIAKLPDFGDIVVKSVMDWLAEKGLDLFTIGCLGEFPSEKTQVTSSKLSGKTVVITGELSIPRKEITKKLEAMGIKISSSVSKNTDYLLVPNNNTEKTSSKYKKAESLGINIVEEDDFLKLL